MFFCDAFVFAFDSQIGFFVFVFFAFNWVFFLQFLYCNVYVKFVLRINVISNINIIVKKNRNKITNYFFEFINILSFNCVITNFRINLNIFVYVLSIVLSTNFLYIMKLIMYYLFVVCSFFCIYFVIVCILIALISNLRYIFDYFLQRKSRFNNEFLHMFWSRIMI